MDKETRKSFLDEIKEEIRQDFIKKYKSRLKQLKLSEAKAKKIVRNVQREIEDLLQEMEIDEDDLYGDFEDTNGK